MMETGIQRNLRFLRVFRQREQDLYISLLIMCKYQFDRIIIYQLHTGRNKPCGISGFIKILCGHTDRFSAKLKRLQIGNDFRLHTNILAIAGVQHQIAKFFRFLFYFNPFSFVLDINLILDKRIPRFLRRSLIKHNFHRIIYKLQCFRCRNVFFRPFRENRGHQRRERVIRNYGIRHLLIVVRLEIQIL